MDRGAWQATVHGVAQESDTTEATQHACFNSMKTETTWILFSAEPDKHVWKSKLMLSNCGPGEDA